MKRKSIIMEDVNFIGKYNTEKVKRKYTTTNDISPKLAEEIKIGNEESFQKLYIHLVKPLTEFARILVSNHQDAEEIVQDIFTETWERREAIDSAKNLKGFIYTCARNRCLDYYRKKKRLSEFAFLQDVEVGVGVTHEDVIIVEETELLIELTVANMPEQRKRIYHLSNSENKSYKEIAELLGITESSVRNHITAARKDIKKVLSIFIFFQLLG